MSTPEWQEHEARRRYAPAPVSPPSGSADGGPLFTDEQETALKQAAYAAHSASGGGSDVFRAFCACGYRSFGSPQPLCSLLRAVRLTRSALAAQPPALETDETTRFDPCCEDCCAPDRPCYTHGIGVPESAQPAARREGGEPVEALAHELWKIDCLLVNPPSVIAGHSTRYEKLFHALMELRSMERVAARSAPAPEGVETLARMLEKATRRLALVRDRMERCDDTCRNTGFDPRHTRSLLDLAGWIEEQEAALAAPRSGAGETIEELKVAALDMAQARQWAMEWPDRYANLVLEASEFTEAWRGKHGDPVKEAGDVLLTYLLAIGAAGVSWADAFAACAAKVAEFRTRPAYHGEFTAAHRAAPLPGGPHGR